MSDAKLFANVQDHLNRLLLQLSDIENSKESLDDAEYIEMKKETIDQLKAIRAAISEAFRTPEIIAIFAKKEPTSLRQKLLQFEHELQKRKITSDTFNQRKAEILYALAQLRDELSDDEIQFLSNYSTIPLSLFEPAPIQTVLNVGNVNIKL
ncbi:unnamed protein product [Dracunculus medinensis]|uniref:Protein LZIC n=1 Tax=Dracunculus medinensis TaxID=318479 RepID=A0A0N4U6L5_DRAME|nr:unnamed protein product [Dracunculus medinensis]